MPTSLADFMRARPELQKHVAQVFHGIKPEPEERQLSSADIPVVIVSDDKTGYRVDALGPCDKFFVPLIESGEFRAAATLGDAYARLDSFNQAGRLRCSDGQLLIDGQRAEEVFKEWAEKQENWKFNSGGLVGPAAYLEGRSIGKVTARLKELDGDKYKLAEEARNFGLTCDINPDNGQMSGTLFQMSKIGTAPAGVKLPAGMDGKPSPQSNPIVNMRDPVTGILRPEMRKKFADMQRARGGQRLIQSWIKEAQALGYSLDGRKIK